tara:strand:+ start:358 stop:1335 length:978 start_codon:yes stop_codon:yes gene_type:complete
MEYLPEFELLRPKTIDQALELKSTHLNSRYLAGGTDMIVNVRRGIENPEVLIDLTALDDFSNISFHEKEIKIGAGVTLSQLSNNAQIRNNFPAITEAATLVAGPTHRQYGTVGGNLCLDTRCLYYNQSQWWRESNNFCLKHLGEVCHVAPGGKKCFAAFSGDIAPALLIYDAEIEIVSDSGSRTIPLSELYRDDGMDHLSLSKEELLVSVRLRSPDDNSSSGYEKSRVRGSIDFPLAGCAVRLLVRSGKIGDLKIAITAVNPYPFLIEGTERFVGNAVDVEVLDNIRDLVRLQAKPMRTTTISPWYRRRVIGALARRITAGLAGK